MSISSENASLGGGSLKGRDPRSPSAIAEFNKRRLHGDYGTQPNAPSIGIKIDGGANTSAIKATNSRLGPKLWHPTSSDHARRASTLASTSSSSFIPEAHYVEDPTSSSLASKAATSAIQVSGEDYGAKHQPDAYNWGKKPSQWSHLGAIRSSAAAQRDEDRSTGLNSLSRAPPNQSIDISKVLSAAQANADKRIADADNHLPSNFGIQTEEQKAERRQQVLSLITIADERVKARMAEMNRDVAAPQNVFGSIEFQKIAMEVAAKSLGGRLDNHGKLNLGGGLYMTQDEVDDIARRNVQPVLDKVQLVADKKRIADREAAEREALAKQQAAEAKEAERQRKAEEKQRAAEEKQRKKQAETAAKQKRERAEARSKEQHPQGSHLWHWQQVEIIKEEVKEAKQSREDKGAEAARLHKAKDQTQTDLTTLVDRHHELKRDYFGRGEAIEAKQAEYDPDAVETASLFELKQERETVKENTKIARQKRTELEQKIEELDRKISEADKESEEAQQHHHDLKKKYFEARAEAEEAEKKWQAEEEARIKREAEERAKREAEEAERRKKEAEEAERKKKEAEEAAAKKKEADEAAARKKQQEKADQAAKPKPSSSTAAVPVPTSPKSKSSAAEPTTPKGKTAEVDDVSYSPPSRSKLLSLGDSRTGPVLAGYKSPVSKKEDTPKSPVNDVSTKETETKEAKADEETKAKEVKADEAKKAEENKEVKAKETKAKEAEETKSAEELNDKNTTEAAIAVTGTAAATAAAPIPGTAEAKDTKDTTEKSSRTYEQVVKDEEARAKATEKKVSKETNDSANQTREETPSSTITEDTSVKGISDNNKLSKKLSQAKPVGGSVAGSVATEKKVSKETNDSANQTREDTPSSTVTENTSVKGISDNNELSKKLSEAKPVGGSVAGSVASKDAKTKLTDEIPLGGVKDQFSGFESSNVKEKVEDSPGVFKEDL